jgi:pilus assembly protein CpaE
MGRIDNIYEPPMNQAIDLPEAVHVVAQASMLPAIESIGSDLNIIECGVDDPLPSSQLGSASVIVIEVDPASRNSLERIDRLRLEMPHIPVIAGLANVDIATSRKLLRRGVSDIVALPFAVDELITAIVDAAENIDPKAVEEVRLAPFVAVLKTIGGAGATTVATHLAAQMAQDMGEHCRACIIDLDLQSGDASSFLGSAPRLTLTDLLEAGDRLDEELVTSVASEGHPLVDVIAAPSEIMPIEALEFEHLMRIVAIARRKYDLVIVDLPASFTNWSLSTVFAADQILLVGLLTIPSLRHAKRQIDFLVSMGIPREKIQMILNRVEKSLFKTISPSDAADALKHPILATMSDEGKLLRSAQDQGELIDDVQKRSKFSKDIMKLADLLSDRLAEA